MNSSSCLLSNHTIVSYLQHQHNITNLRASNGIAIIAMRATLYQINDPSSINCSTFRPILGRPLTMDEQTLRSGPYHSSIIF